MGTSTIHPSQRRLSCDVCRRHKTRCQRIRQNDPKCARCTMLGEECNIGGQKKVGRPRKSDSAPGQRAGKASIEEPRAKPVRSQKKQTTAKNQQSDPSPSSVSPVSGIFPKMNDQHGIESMMFSTTTIPTTTTSSAAPPVVGTTTNVVFALESSWPAAGTAEQQTSSPPPTIPWNVSSCFKHSSAFADYDWNIDENDVLKTKSSQSDLTVICSDPASLVIPELGAPMGSIDLSDALSKLSKLNNDLHIRMAAIESHRSVMTLTSILFREGPLFIDNFTLGEFTMRSTLELFQVLSRLLNNRQCHAPLDGAHKLDIVNLPGLDGQSSSPHLYGGGHNGHGQGPSPNLASPFPSASLQPLLAPLALTITAVFTQLISLYEVVLKHMILWLEDIAAEPLRPIPGLRIGEAWPQDLCAQGIRFSNASLNLLERIEQILGLTGRPEWGGPGLLSIQQIDLLWSVLDGGEGIAPGHGFMRPAYVKRSLRKALSVLSRVMSRQVAPLTGSLRTSARPGDGQSTSASPYAKRLKDNRIVNISTTRAYVYWDDSSEICAYTWTRGRGGRCWVRDEELEDREEVDGKYLLCYDYVRRKSGKCELAAIEVRFNEDIQVLEGWRALEAVGLSAMIQ